MDEHTNIEFDNQDNVWYFDCIWCNNKIAVEDSEVRCTIFRHAVFKKNMEFVPPHASKNQCEQWLNDESVWGCAKPFIFNRNTVKKCDYI